MPGTSPLSGCTSCPFSLPHTLSSPVDILPIALKSSVTLWGSGMLGMAYSHLSQLISDFTPVAWNQSWWRDLHHRNWQTLHIRLLPSPPKRSNCEIFIMLVHHCQEGMSQSSYGPLWQRQTNYKKNLDCCLFLYIKYCWHTAISIGWRVIYRFFHTTATE